MAFTQVPSKSSGDVFSLTMWSTYIQANLNKLGVQGHRRLTVAAFLALTGLEDGDEAYVEVDNTNGIVWHFRYDSASSKWEFLGGAPLYAEVLTDETAGTTGYTDLSTTGPSITVPLACDYDIQIGSSGYDTLNSGQNTMTALKVGSATTVDADAISNIGAAAAPGIGSSRRFRKTAVAVSTVLKLEYKRVNSTSHWRSRTLAVTPARFNP